MAMIVYQQPRKERNMKLKLKQGYDKEDYTPEFIAIDIAEKTFDNMDLSDWYDDDHDFYHNIIKAATEILSEVLE